ncbi:MAG: potassium channel family protein [Gammaproteobacteria bacterium]|nr:potassium channel family protein [Gammaproteobacteria bacterium]
MAVPFHALIGLSGVSPHENQRAKFWDKVFQWPMLMLVLWMPFQFYLDFQMTTEPAETVFFDWLVWCFFVIESVLLVSVVDNKKRYLRSNWMNLLIICAGLPIILWGYSPLAAILRSLRLLLMVGLVYRLTKTVRKILSRNQLGATLLVSLLLVLLSGIIITAIDPAFESPSEGIWWALVTVSTVGYGDFTPVSGPGRIFAAVLIIAGVVLFSLVTANLAAYFVEKEVEKDVEAETREEEIYLDKAVSRLERRLIKIEQQLKQIAADKSDKDS